VDGLQAKSRLAIGGRVNWLTLRMAGLDSFGSLHDGGVPHEDSSLRRLPFWLVEQALIESGTEVDFGLIRNSISDAHLYSEDLQSATRRIGEARIVLAAVFPTEEPLRFTTGLIDGAQTVLYLPDDDTDEPDVQLFAGPESGPIARLRIRGDLALDSAHLTELDRQAPQACADGPCVEWMSGCGGGDCFCHKFPDVEDRLRDRLRRAWPGAERHRPAVLKCHPENPFGGQG
jgi:hypothetical protein